jgi:hypothetical protein
VIAVELDTARPVEVVVELSRAGKTIARKRVDVAAEGEHVLRLRVPGKVEKGRAKVTVELVDAAGNELALRRSVRLPKPA